MTDKATRRNFIDRAVIATSALAAAELIPFSASGAPSSPAGPAPGTQKLRAIGEITSEGGKLRAVITVKNAKRTVPTPAPANLTATDTMMLRYFDGHRPDGSQQWPPNVRAKTGYPAPGPGPTLRAKLGDQVQIALLNHVRPTDFRRTLDVERCDHVRNSGTAPAPGTTMSPNATPPPDVYPRNDHYPDCLHGSSSANIHFHGTHVTPSTTGDNVLINVRPNRGVLERDVLPAFDKIWNHCEVGHQPLKWGDLPRQWRDYQRALLIALPEQQLWHDNEAAIAAGVWPQWHVGAYPYCFQIPHYREGVRNDVEMGQSPGTHWYHSHKHGSTAINMFNGLSGAFIITDDSPDGYDGKLHRFYAKQGRKLTEHVLVFQQIIDTPNMLSNSPSGRSATLVNGQYAPVIDMQPGDVQLWRMINANVSNIVPISFTRLLGGTAPAAAATPSPAPSSAPASSGFTYKQTAQDGVQLGWDNYNASTNTNPTVALDPANRVDLLVQAPATPGTYVVMDGPPHKKNIPIFYVRVAGNSVSLTQPFPATRNDYPRMPSFLRDLDSKNILVRREIDYGWLGNLTQPGQIPDGFPQFTINGRQFQDRTIDEVMLLGSKEEWTVLNSTTGIPHPFHIHINPFQIFEVFAPAFDPTGKTPPNYLPFVVPQPFVWWDTFGIPPGVLLPKIDPSTGKPLVDPKTGAPPIDPRTGKPAVLGAILPGYFKMRSRFVDFTGLYVQHCHILTHEDRGMMQLLEVVSNKTILKHH